VDDVAGPVAPVLPEVPEVDCGLDSPTEVAGPVLPVLVALEVACVGPLSPEPAVGVAVTVAPPPLPPDPPTLATVEPPVVDPIEAEGWREAADEPLEVLVSLALTPELETGAEPVTGVAPADAAGAGLVAGLTTDELEAVPVLPEVP